MKIKCPHCLESFDPDDTSVDLSPDTQGIVDMIKLFSAVNPGIKYGHRGIRDDADFLIKKLGYEKAINTANYAISIQGRQYAPTITDPIALRRKLGDLMAYYQRENAGRSVIIN